LLFFDKYEKTQILTNAFLPSITSYLLSPVSKNKTKMFKLVAVLLMVVVVCNGFITGNVGSYSDRPELLSDQTVQD
jgi:hypothetical protein